MDEDPADKNRSGSDGGAARDPVRPTARMLRPSSIIADRRGGSYRNVRESLRNMRTFRRRACPIARKKLNFAPITRRTR